MIKERGRLLTAVLLGAWCLVFAVQAGAQTGGPHLFVFNMGSEDVTIIDPATNQVVGTRPVGFKVKWLADHMQSFDGTLLWTYGLRTEKIGAAEVLKVDAIAFDPATGQVTHRLAVGKFPCDLHLSPDGRLAYFPERDQDTVSALNVTARQVVNRVNFPKGSKPHMLRASPDGKYVWVQNAVANTNEILDGHTLEVVNVQPVGKHPTTNAWTLDGRYSWVLHEGDNHVIVMEAHPPFRQLKRIEVGPSPLNVSFRPDGKYAYVTVGGLNAVAVIDTATMTVETMLPAGRTPSGMVLLNVRPRL